MDGRFGTENAGPLLSALVRFTRPRSLLEVGAGQTTLYLLDALSQAVSDDRRERDLGPPPHGVRTYYEVPYRPHLTVLDDLSLDGTTAGSVADVVARLGVDDMVSFVNADFRGYSRQVPASRLPFDFIWFDCGGLDEYVDFVHEYWPLVNADGGLVVLHSTQSNLMLRLFVERLEQRLRDPEPPGYELLSLAEPHKTAQNSVTIIRMTSQLSRPIYAAFP